ncbi:phosphate acyltransferase [Mycolicibacterium obuense]|uniref:phosphate acyltransferase n=1 Tax=Mycolicibacterium obuense TaxID=1807 RepID=UPI000699308E|nr:phosphate acyltransferase [Mycolicibacterium obuense]
MSEPTLLREPPPVDLSTVPAAVVQPLSAACLHAVHGAYAAGLIAPVIIGDRRRLESLAANSGIALPDWIFHDTGSDEAAADLAASLAAAGDVSLVIKGNIKTDILMRAVLRRRGTSGEGGRLSHVFAIDMPSVGYHKRLYVTDGALNVSPSVDVKEIIANNAIDLLQSLGIQRPKIAVLSAAETINSAMPSSVEAAEVAERIQARALALGPVALDVALSSNAASVKGIDSPVAGDADLLVCPNIESANGLVKMAARQPGTVIAGLVIGGTYPIVLPSRGDAQRSQLASCGLGRKYLAWLQYNDRRR